MASTSAHSTSVHAPTFSLPSKGDGDVDGEIEGLVIDPQVDGESLSVSEYGHKRPNEEYYPGGHHRAQFEDMRRTGSIDQCEALGLNQLQDCDPIARPGYPISTIILCAIGGSPRERLTISEIYLAIERRFPYYGAVDNVSWRRSVRHSLSTQNMFHQETRLNKEPGKGNYWVVAKDKPRGQKRPRKNYKKPVKCDLVQMALEAVNKELQAQPSGATNSNSTPCASSSLGSIPADPSLPGMGATVPETTSFSITAGTLPANAGYAEPTAEPVQGASASWYADGSTRLYFGQFESVVRGGTRPPPQQLQLSTTVTSSHREESTDVMEDDWEYEVSKDDMEDDSDNKEWEDEMEDDSDDYRPVAKRRLR